MLRTTVSDLYAAPFTLWVEDHLTRLVLTELWGDKDIRVVTAGGRAGVEFLARSAPPTLAGRAVAGLVDRDFSPDNVSSWEDPDVLLLRIPAHEFENLLLDFSVLSAVSRKQHSATDIEAVAKTFAESLRWWMVCKHALQELNRDVNAEFPQDPALPPSTGSPQTQQAASDYILGSRYWKAHKDTLNRWQTGDIKRRIGELGDRYEDDLQNGEWVRSFSGKEIFRHLRCMPGLSGRARGGTASQNDENLGTLIGREMRKPSFAASSDAASILGLIRAALRKRARLAP